MSYLSPPVIAAAQAHAREEYPAESCGLVVKGVYVPCQNIAADPLQDFEISAKVYKSFLLRGGVEAIIHSHPDGPFFPSQADMESQIATNVPWAIIAVDDELRVSEPVIWGDQIPIPPLIGRQFMHGVTDCYSIVRDGYRLGKDGMAAQGMPHWPYPSIVLPEVPRDDNWWSSGQDLYIDLFAKFGFREINIAEARPGDCFLKALGTISSNPHKRINHAGILISHDQLVHHKPGKLSAREPSGLWGRAADMWLRYEGAGIAA